MLATFLLRRISHIFSIPWALAAHFPQVATVLSVLCPTLSDSHVREAKTEASLIWDNSTPEREGLKPWNSEDCILSRRDESMRRFPQGSADVAGKSIMQEMLVTHTVSKDE